MLLLLLACTPSPDGKPGDSAPTDSAETGETGDTGETADTGDGEETGDTGSGETGETAIPDTGVLHAEVDAGGLSRTLDCGPGEDAIFTHTFVDAMGNTAGSVVCTSAVGETVQLLFTSGRAGSWTAPDGFDFSYVDTNGAHLQYGAAGSVTTAWALDVTTYTRTSTKTIDLAATFSGSWTDEAGSFLGSISGSVETELRCDAC